MSIEVHVRTRPGVSSPVWSSAETVLYSTVNPNTRYVYNKVYPSNSTNHNIFQNIEAIVHAAVDGKNVTIMAYGQTGSGKTYSMIGTNEDPGIVPRTARLLLELKRSMPGLSVQAYYTEIYNESVKDLLEPQRGELALHDAPDGGVYFDKKVVTVESFEDFLALQALAERNRKYGVTNLNDHSSRSHIILTFELHRSTTTTTSSSNTESSDAGRTMTLTSVINLVDLAGSESATRANTEGTALREGGFINRSLLALGNVVDAIVEKRAYVPYRDAKLTRVLRTCLGGLGITFILCCVNPSRANMEQTVATLRFTQRAMKIKNDPVMQLQIPPLFTHQYSRCVQQLIEGIDESCTAAYQNGLRDAYLYCGSTSSSIMGTFHAQLTQAMSGFATVQRLLVAHDHACAVGQLGRLHGRLHELRQQTARNVELAASERKRQRELSEEVVQRKAKLASLEAALSERSAIADTELAGWEYQLHELQHKQISEKDLLHKAECCGRAKIEYEWAVCMERIVSRAVPTLQGLMFIVSEAKENNTENNNNSASTQGDNTGATRLSSSSTVLAMSNVKELQNKLRRARAELADLEMAYDMIKDDLALDKRREETKQTQQTTSQRTLSSTTTPPPPQIHSTLPSASVSPQPRMEGDAVLSTVGTTSGNDDEEANVLQRYEDVPDKELERRISALEQEKQHLLARAKRQVRRQSLRQVRESMMRYVSPRHVTPPNITRQKSGSLTLVGDTPEPQAQEPQRSTSRRTQKQRTQSKHVRQEEEEADATTNTTPTPPEANRVTANEEQTPVPATRRGRSQKRSLTRRTADNNNDTSSSTSQQQGMNGRMVSDAPQLAGSSAHRTLRASSRDPYAEGVRNALSVLDSLKQRLLTRPQSPAAAGRTRSRSKRSRRAAQGDDNDNNDSARSISPVTSSSSFATPPPPPPLPTTRPLASVNEMRDDAGPTHHHHRHHHRHNNNTTTITSSESRRHQGSASQATRTAKSRSHDDCMPPPLDENLTLLELYKQQQQQQQRQYGRHGVTSNVGVEDKENAWAQRHHSTAYSTTLASAKHTSTSATRGIVAAAAAEEDDALFWEPHSQSNGHPQRECSAQPSRAVVVERALWGLHANSQSPSLSRDRQSCPRHP